MVKDTTRQKETPTGRNGASRPAEHAPLTAQEYNEIVAGSLSESAWQSQVVSLAESLKLLCYHTRDSRGSDRGFPDLVILGERRTIFMELKRQNGTLTTDQVKWLDGLARVRDSGDSAMEVYGAVKPMDREALIAALYGPSVSEADPLHQWCLSPVCGRCNEERGKARTVYPSRRKRASKPRRS